MKWKIISRAKKTCSLLINSVTGELAVTRKQFGDNQAFDTAMRKLIAVPKGVIEQREAKWKAAKKKAAKKR